MATLSGTRLKDTYTGLLKTSDAGNFTGTLKVIQDGSGNDSGLSLSSNTVKASALQIDSPTVDNSTTDVLIWHSSSKEVRRRALPVFESVTTTIAGADSPTITIADAGGTTKTATFVGSDGIGLSRTGDTINIFRSSTTINTINSATVLTGAGTESNSDFFIDASGGAFNITLPSAGGGLRYKFFISDMHASTGFTITPKSDSDVLYGRATVISTTENKSDVQIVDKENGLDTLTLLPASATNGGNAGDTIECIAVDESNWLVVANLTTTNASPSGISVFS